MLQPKDIDWINGTKTRPIGTSLVVQWLRFHASNARSACLIPVREQRSHMLSEKKKKIHNNL